ncbi:MAG TPA: ABC transporter permease [Vicinamibacterales bacterium]
MTIESLGQDLGYALRVLRRSPAFTAVVLLTVALGVGANTAVFAVVDAALLKPLPYPSADRIVTAADLAPGTFLDWRNQAASFTALATLREADFDLSGGDRPERLTGAIVTGSFFDVMGVAPALGRTLVPADDDSGQRPVVLSNATWRRRFGADAGIVGRSIVLNGAAHVVVGVMPAAFLFPPGAAELWVAPRHVVPEYPLAPTVDQTQNRGGHYLGAYGRLKPGVTLGAAQREQRAIFTRLLQQYPNDVTQDDVDLVLVPLREWLVGDITPALMVLLAVAGLVLLIACANIANLMLARASGRAQEIGIRTALGAGRGRIARQLLTESVVLAVLGGGLGVLTAWWILPVLLAMSPEDVQGVNTAMNRTVVLFALGVSVVTGTIFGCVPALQAARGAVASTLRSVGRTTGGSGERVRQALIVAECAASVVLLVGAGLLLRSFVSLRHVDPGFTSAGLVTTRIALPAERYGTPARQAQFFDRLLERVGSAPGVSSAALAGRLPFVSGNSTRSFDLETPAGSDTPVAGFRVVSPSYFDVLGQPLRSGRGFNERDTAEAPLVAVINEIMARKYWPNADPIGKRFRIGGGTRWTEIVGIVGNVKHGSLREPLAPEFYVPYRQLPWSAMSLVVRTPLAAPAAAATIEHELAAVDPALPAMRVRAMNSLISTSFSMDRFEMVGLGVFAAVALALAVGGLYGVMSYVVSRRTREIGVRIALGATPASILRLVMRDGLRLTAVGIALGLAGSFVAARAIRSWLYGIGAADPLTFVAVTAVLAAVAALACYLPARRAMATEPTQALRAD